MVTHFEKADYFSQLVGHESQYDRRDKEQQKGKDAHGLDFFQTMIEVRFEGIIKKLNVQDMFLSEGGGGIILAGIILVDQ